MGAACFSLPAPHMKGTQRLEPVSPASLYLISKSCSLAFSHRGLPVGCLNPHIQGCISTFFLLPYYVTHPAHLPRTSLVQHAEANLRDHVTAVARFIVWLASDQVIDMVISEPFLNEPINLGGKGVLLSPLLSKKGKFLNALDSGGTEASDLPTHI